MCETWNLSMPRGTIFAFKINAQRTLAHLSHADLNIQLALEDKERGFMVGYVRDSSPSGLDIGILAENSETDDGRRKGLSINTRHPEAKKSSNKLHEAYVSSKKSFGNKALHSPFARWVTPTNIRRCREVEENIFLKIVPHGTPLRPTVGLPWGKAYAYRPSSNYAAPSICIQDDKGAHRIRSGKGHQCTVGLYSSEGILARTQVRFSRGEVARAEKVMDQMMEGKKQEIEHKIEGREMFELLPSRSSPPKSATSLNSNSKFCTSGIETASNSLSSIPFLYFGDYGDEKLIEDGAKFRESSSSRPLLIVIDIFLDLELAEELPRSPEEFENTVFHLEELERRARMGLI